MVIQYLESLLRFERSGRWGSGQSRCLVVQVLGLLLLGFVFCIEAATAAAPLELSARPYPVGDMRVTREDVTSQSLRLNFSNLNLNPGKSNRQQTQTWMVAGVKGQIPTISINSAVFIHLKNGLETTSTAEIPDQLKQNMTRVADLGLMRQYWLYSLTLTTVSPSGLDGFWILKDASINVDIGPAKSSESHVVDRWSGGFGGNNLTGGLLINPDIDSAYYVNEYADPVDAWTRWSELASKAADSGNLFRFSVFQGGFYRLSLDDLKGVASAVTATTPSQWRVYKNGEEVPLYQDPAGVDNAVFLPVGKTPAEGLQEIVYWLDTSGSDSVALKPARLVAEALSAQVDSGSGGTSVSSVGTFKINHRELTNFNPKLKAGPGLDKWYWTDVNAGLSTKLELEFPDHFAPAPGTTIRTTLRYGFTNFPPVPPELVIYAGNGEVFKTKLATQMGSAVLDLPANLFHPGLNQIALLLDYETTNDQRPVVIQDIETEWKQELAIPKGQGYNFNLDASSSTGSLELQFLEAIPKNVVVFGFESEPVLLSSVDSAAVSETSVFSEYMVANTEAPDRIYLPTRADPFKLNDFVSAQSVIITTPEMAEMASRLLEKHKEQGLSSTLLVTDAIYNTFSYGRPDPAAIQSVLRYMFYKGQSPAPQYVTLIGEASDYRGDPRLAPPGVQLDMIPASSANMPESPQGDERYASVLGSDLVADFIVGRIPAANPEQLADYMAKHDAYTQGKAGPWSRIAEFIMDDNDEFPDVVDQIMSSAMAPLADARLLRQWDYEYVPNLRVAGKKRSWTATQAVVDSFNAGLGVLNFFGHGGPNLWSHERLFHLSDLDFVTNKARLPLITCASCDNAWISYPMPPVKVSMGEELVLKPDGGAIGVFGPVAGASPYEHSTLVQGLMEGILRTQLRRIGDAVFYAQNRYYAITRSASIPEQYLLLGDPTVALRMPLVTADLIAEPAEIRAGEGSTVAIMLRNGAPTASTGTLKLSTSGETADLATVSVGSGESSWRVNIPQSYKGGMVMALLEVETAGETHLAGTAFRVLPQFHVADGLVAQRTRLTGGGFDIVHQAEPYDTSSASASIYHFQIKSEQTTGAVRIAALHDGRHIGEVSSLEITSASEFIDFDMPMKGLIDSSSATVQLEVYPLATSGKSEPVTTATFEVPVSGAAALKFIPNSGRAYSGNGKMVSGATIFLEGELLNTGQRAAENFTIQALRDDPSTGSELQTINEASSLRIDHLGPGESSKVIFRWEASASGTYPAIYLVANNNKIVMESDFTDNSLLIPEFTVLPIGNFSVKSFEVTPHYARPGTTVTVSAVLSNGDHLNDRPVKVELGWERTYDNKTSSSKFPISFTEGVATVTQELVAPDDFDQVYVFVNSDFEIEEADMADNKVKSASMIVSNIPDFETSTSLSSSITLGGLYNFIMPLGDHLRIASDFTSASNFLLPTQNDVTSGSVTSLDSVSDGSWRVIPWRITVGASESPGPLGITMPVESLAHDVPGVLEAYLDPYPGAIIPLQTRFDETAEWVTPTFIGDVGNNKRLSLGLVASQNGTISWQIRKSGAEGFNVGYLKFLPSAAEWESPPYLLHEDLRFTPLNFEMDTNDQSKWASVFVDWRSGETVGEGNISWSDWTKSENLWSVQMTAAEYLQVRITGVPVTNEKPYLKNFRIVRP